MFNDQNSFGDLLNDFNTFGNNQVDDQAAMMLPENPEIDMSDLQDNVAFLPAATQNDSLGFMNLQSASGYSGNGQNMLGTSIPFLSCYNI